MDILSDDGGTPLPRSGHVAITWRDRMYVWGGYNHNENGFEKWINSKTVWTLNLNTFKWTRHRIEGTVPPPSVGCGYSCINGKLIVFGGCCMVDFNHRRTPVLMEHPFLSSVKVEFSPGSPALLGLFCGVPFICPVVAPTEKRLVVPNNQFQIWIFDLPSLKWELLEPSGLKPSERNKTACCVFKNKLIVFAGYGPEPLYGCHLYNGDFDLDLSSIAWNRGWNNDLVAFDLGENKWISLANEGDRPSTRAAHAMTTVGNKAYLFGGRHLRERLNDLYSLCLDTFQWTSINYTAPSGCPIGRSWHSLTATSDSQLFLFGGIDSSKNILDDSWMFDASNFEWRKAPVAPQCRLWHTACRGLSREEIVVFGGCLTSIFEDTKHSDQVSRFFTQPKSLMRICLEFLSLHRKTWKGKNDYLPVCLYRKLKRISGDGG